MTKKEHRHPKATKGPQDGAQQDVGLPEPLFGNYPPKNLNQAIKEITK
ncbi:Protein of unknown function [Propionibacterium freudenreichii]|nr:hypothetical protein [Propionibacterium freudenreichii]MDK9674425.1 hypothetical protein [Propionibacterium freudenreichii]CEI46733.1 Protein of unknown function [Propionibacterium freudenreichii]SCQ46794.1 Hypothetical protein PFR_JS7-1_1844 [Propionibacterium freudenreichii]SCQ56332.1 Hypothetical protein PFR_JS7-PH_9 [Propionibacterium freudenreichii]